MDQRKIRVLVADDYELVRHQICNLLLTQPDIEICVECVDGADAVEKARLYKPDLVLMDVNMPVMNGIDAARIIHAENPTINTLMVSQHDSSEFIKQAMAIGASNYVVKSNAARDLIPAIRSL